MIRVEALGKKFILKHSTAANYTALRDVLAESARNGLAWLPGLRRKANARTEREEFWALRGLSMAVAQGERVGIIGRNGAGKSTLLKILSRITEPTEGRVRIRGRVASLLEVGTGFHPELTGRENIFLNGVILGMSKAEVARKFDEIVAFAEVERFLDTPVKRYSSGMYVRLAFAVAAHLEPEILIVDEVLAVGDLHFQRKCLGKMKDVSAGGRTVLFVSHNMAAIAALCDRAIVLERGRLVGEGPVADMIELYATRGPSGASRHLYTNREQPAPDAKAHLLDVGIYRADGQATAEVLLEQPWSLRIVWRLQVPVPFLRLGVEIVDPAGTVVLSSMDTDTTELLGKPRAPGVYRATLNAIPYLLMPGRYSVRVFAGMPRVERILEVDSVVEFDVIDHASHLTHVTNAQRTGYIAMPLNWTVESIHAA